jgi:hypothetical protein
MKWHAFRIFCVSVSLCSGLTAADQASRFAHTNSRSNYVHWIDLYDANNRRIDPADPNAGPYSPMTTCGRCHDYESIASGHHFNAMGGSLPAGRAGEPWIWTDDRTGTQLPLSYRAWEGTYHPNDVGISPWDFVLKFGRHLPGGGPGQPPKQDAAAQDAAAPGESAPEGAEPQPTPASADRWRLSGWLQVDCMLCHSNDHVYSPEVWWNQIKDQNFAWAPTAAAGLGSVDGKVSGLADDFDPANAAPGGRNRLPTTTYHSLRINGEKKVFFDVVRTPDDRTCYYCHTTQPAGSDAMPMWNQDEDVHLRAGMTCTDCHRNDIGHHTVRGYEGETHPTGLSVASLSCRGCHMDGDDGQGGRMGAPKPLHVGLPALHLNKLSCTACHSGPAHAAEAQPIHTALAHGLGLPSHAYTSDLAPGIVEPVLLQDQGKLYPHRMTWPAFWGKLKDGAITPLNPDATYDALRSILRIRRGQTLVQTLSAVKMTDDDKTNLLGEERAKVDEAERTDDERAKIAAWETSKAKEAWFELLGKSLSALKETVADDGAEPVYISGGRAYRLGAEDKPEAFEHSAAQPYAWKLGHDVRSARASSGATSCFECHAAGSPIFEGRVTAVSAVPEDDPIVHSMWELAGYDKQMLDAWNLSFQGRPMFKYAGFAVMGLVALIMLAYSVRGIHGLFGRLRRA